jgi:hypothetical protein
MENKPKKSLQNVILSIIYILILLSLISCQSNRDKKNAIDKTIEVETVEENPRLELIPEPNKEERLEWEKQRKALLSKCYLENPDSSVNGISIRNAISTEKVLGKETKLGGDWTYRNLNLDKSKFLNLTVHSGDYYNQVSIFEVGYSTEILKGDKFLSYDDFQTEKGIKLGLTKDEIIKTFGNCYETRDSTMIGIKLVYRIELPQDTKNNFLSNQNMPIYYAEYEFEKDKLIRYEFGFEYP